MKNTIQKAILLSGLVSATLAISPTVLADASNTSNATKTATGTTAPAKKSADEIKQDKVNKAAIKAHEKSQNDLLKHIDKGVAEGFSNVSKAVKLIAEKKEKEAIKLLQDATGKFDIAIAAKPEIALIPIDAKVVVHELTTTPAAIKAQVALANGFLKDSKVQAARAVLLPLRDDIESHSVFLPMRTYPDAIKLATKMLVDGKKEAALATISTAFSTIVEKTAITPLSLIRVAAITQSASLVDKEKEKDKALILLGAAEEQLKIATALGYTSEHSDLYKDLSTQIAALKKEITGGNVVERLYKKLRDSIASLMKKNAEEKESTKIKDETKKDETKKESTKIKDETKKDETK